MAPEMAREQPPIGVIGTTRRGADVESDLLAGEIILRPRGRRGSVDREQENSRAADAGPNGAISHADLVSLS
jgi:hypothetical protein